jgi:Tol biopolymer transport system component
MNRNKLLNFLVAIILFACGTPKKIVTINSSPSDASVYLKGKMIGKTPLPTTLLFEPKAIIHKIEIQKDGYKKETVRVPLKPKEVTSYNSNLSYDYKNITINSVPTNAKVLLNGVENGLTPYVDSLTVEQIDTRGLFVQLKMDGYEDTSVTIDYFPFEETSFNVKMKKRDVVYVNLVSFESISTDDGVKLNKVVRSSVAYLEVIERSSSVKSVTRVTQNQESESQIGAPIVSPIGDAIIYPIFSKNAADKPFSNLWKQNIGSFSKTSITNGQSLDIFPAYSADGKDIYFSSNRTSSNTTVWRIKAEGAGGITKITNTQSEDFGVSSFPDGKSFAYTSNPPNANESQIWMTTSTGALPTQLKEGESPKVCPDTTNRIMFIKKDTKNILSRINDNPRQIWIMNNDGSNLTQLTQNILYNINDAQWSPDGKWIVYTSDEGLDSRGNNNYDIWVMKSNGTNKTQLTTNGSWDDSPCFGRKGKTIYFRSNRGGNWDIWRFEPILD